ncbi:hypothetical protein JCM10295v2_006166 [Rhodotorula toruloides]
MALSSKEDIRRQLNLKNLQRHDPAIDHIVSSASYASVYDNKGDGWVKSGVEGPMFLFARSTAPHYGFFILNRNGLEYVQEFLTPESEVEIGGEFILYEGGQDADRATGIWVFEEKERTELCKQMTELRSRAAAIAAASAQSPPSTKALPTSSPLPVGKSISLDMLFQAASPAPAAPTLPQQPAQTSSNPLDALFAPASISPSPARAILPPAQPQPVSPSVPKLPATLEQLFAAASPTPQPARLPAQMPPQSPPQQPAGGMALLDSIFASARSPNLPYSLTPSIAQPPAPSAPASQPNDAHALLAMLGHPLSPPVQPAQPIQANPLVNGDISLAGAAAPVKSPPAPHSATYPQPFAMDPQPSTMLSKSPSVSPPVQGDEPKKDEKQTQGHKQPMFAPPVLSHDIFANLPLPGGAAEKKQEAVKKEEEKSVRDVKAVVTPQEEQDVRPNEQDSAVLARLDGVRDPAEPDEPIASPPAAVETVKSPISPLQFARHPSSQQPLLLDKSEITSFVNGAATNAAVGMVDGAGPMEKDEFIRRVVELIQKPSLSMQLYGKYLERYEEQHE